jgi:hypothetical protein
MEPGDKVGKREKSSRGLAAGNQSEISPSANLNLDGQHVGNDGVAAILVALHGLPRNKRRSISLFVLPPCCVSIEHSSTEFLRAFWRTAQRRTVAIACWGLVP